MKQINKKAFPEGIQPGKWKVKEGFGAVNLSDLELFVPLGTKEHQKAIRNHEYFHIRFSPKNNNKDVRNEHDSTAINAFEDCRVNILGTKMKVDVSKVVRDEELVKFLQIENVFLKASLVISAFKYDAYKKIKATLSPIERDIVEKFIIKIENNVENADKVQTLAQEFVDLFFPPQSPEPEQKLEETVKKIREEITEGEQTDWNKIHSGRMTIKRPALTIRNVWHTKKRSNTGLTLRHPERVLTDMKCFEDVKRAAFKGTILIDCSGSMKFVVEKLREIVTESCGAQVAGYSGYNCNLGDLIVLSDKGHMIQEIPKMPKGNWIDLPAVEWLSKQHGIKIWVSDGKVADQNECFKIVEKHGIINVISVEETIELLRKLKKKR